LRFKDFSKFLIGVEIKLNKYYFMSWSQIQKTSFLWMKFMPRVNSKKWPNYTTRVIHRLSIFFFRKVDDTIMMEFAILLTKIVLKYPHQKEFDEKTFSSIL